VSRLRIAGALPASNRAVIDGAHAMPDPFRRRRAGSGSGPREPKEGLAMQETESLDQRRRTLRRNLLLVASYLAVMALIAAGYR
jgi:hypothetical protein